MDERFQSRVREIREREILAAAEDLLARRGCIEFSVGEVASHVGVAKGTVYLHFTSRSVLIRRALDEAGARACASLEERFHSGQAVDVLAAIGDYVRSSVGGIVPDTRIERRALAYPCCLRLISCPFGDRDSAATTIANALDQEHGSESGSGHPWNGATVSGWIRILLATMFASGAAVGIDWAAIDAVLDLIRQGLGPPPDRRTLMGP